MYLFIHLCIIMFETVERPIKEKLSVRKRWYSECIIYLLNALYSILACDRSQEFLI